MLLCQQALGGDSVWRRALNISEAPSVSRCLRWQLFRVPACVCVSGACGNQPLYALQMSSCLIINPTFHAYVNFIITDTCIRLECCTSACMCICIHTYTHTHATACAPAFPTATLEEQLHQRQLSLISLYLRHLFLAYSFSPLSLHTFFFPLWLVPLCFPFFVSYPASFSPLPLSALPTC